MANTARTELQAFSSIGIDIGKDVLHLVGFNRSGQIVLRRKIKRMALISTFETLLPCIVGMAACFWCFDGKLLSISVIGKCSTSFIDHSHLCG